MATVMLPTVEEVQSVTAVAVTEQQLTRAIHHITAATGKDVTVEPMTFSTRDNRLLRGAIMWQAAYLAENAANDPTHRPGNMVKAAANGVSVEYEGGAGGSIVAPLAEMYLKRLSWKRSRSIPLVRELPGEALRQNTVYDGRDSDWRPL